MLALFIVYACLYRESENQKQKASLKEHASVIKSSVWNWDKKGLLSYISLASERDNYSSIVIVDQDGKIFLDFKGKELQGFDQFLFDEDLIRTYELKEVIKHENKLIGEIVVLYRSKAIYAYFYAFTVFFLSYLALTFFLRILFEKHTLEENIKERTQELVDEIGERKKAEAQLRQSEMETNQRNKELLLLNRVITGCATARRPEMVLQTACRELVLAFGLSQASAILFNEHRTHLKVIAEFSLDSLPSKLDEILLVEENLLISHLLSNQGSLIVENINVDDRVTSIKHLLPPDTNSFCIVPILIKSASIGGFLLIAEKTGLLSSQELSLVKSVAEQVAGVFVRTQLVDQKKDLETQFLQSQKMEAIGQLTAGISHDFNNLLTGITGFTQLIIMKMDKNDPFQKFLENILCSSERAANLIRQLLTFSRKQLTTPKVLSINTTVIELKDFLKRIIGENIILETCLEKNLSYTKIDPCQLDQIIVNLTVNACDAMPKGGKLKIQTENVVLDESIITKHFGAMPGKYILLSVEDNGFGMTKETKNRIFEPFFTTKEKGKGTGLGLSTVFGIVKQNGGQIWVESELGVGTCFKIYFPFIEKPDLQTGSENIDSLELYGNETILIVEDDELVLKMASITLREYGYRVIEAVNGAKAVESATKDIDSIHLLLTDVVLPDISGKTVADKLIDLKQDLKILFMSGYVEDTIFQHGVLNSNVYFLQKPFFVENLVKKVREVLDN